MNFHAGCLYRRRGIVSCGLRAAGSLIRSCLESVTSESDLAALQFRSFVVRRRKTNPSFLCWIFFLFYYCIYRCVSVKRLVMAARTGWHLLGFALCFDFVWFRLPQVARCPTCDSTWLSCRFLPRLVLCCLSQLREWRWNVTQDKHLPSGRPNKMLFVQRCHPIVRSVLLPIHIPIYVSKDVLSVHLVCLNSDRKLKKLINFIPVYGRWLRNASTFLQDMFFSTVEPWMGN